MTCWWWWCDCCGCCRRYGWSGDGANGYRRGYADDRKWLRRQQGDGGLTDGGWRAYGKRDWSDGGGYQVYYYYDENGFWRCPSRRRKVPNENGDAIGDGYDDGRVMKQIDEDKARPWSVDWQMELEATRSEKVAKQLDAFTTVFGETINSLMDRMVRLRETAEEQAKLMTEPCEQKTVKVRNVTITMDMETQTPNEEQKEELESSREQAKAVQKTVEALGMTNDENSDASRDVVVEVPSETKSVKKEVTKVRKWLDDGSKGAVTKESQVLSSCMAVEGRRATEKLKDAEKDKEDEVSDAGDFKNGRESMTRTCADIKEAVGVLQKHFDQLEKAVKNNETKLPKKTADEKLECDTEDGKKHDEHNHKMQELAKKVSGGDLRILSSRRAVEGGSFDKEEAMTSRRSPCVRKSR
eukprot:TRINITY_DN18333_c0_g1_i1.p1 TRINITY_DN18333_c0_g1~~TRINITY_DN18333_c0_g1_i1.p1  ORF type:complete len:411 (+),score=113.94 TRINITY_DN18333_c0_g1_i1:111-1343(+)